MIYLPVTCHFIRNGSKQAWGLAVKGRSNERTTGLQCFNCFPNKRVETRKSGCPNVLILIKYIMTSMMKYYCILLLHQFGVPGPMSTDPLLLRSRQGLIAHGVRFMEHLRNPWYSAAISVSFWWIHYLMLSSPPTLCARLSRLNGSILYVRAYLYTLYKYQNICTHTWIYIALYLWMTHGFFFTQ